MSDSNVSSFPSPDDDDVAGGEDFSEDSGSVEIEDQETATVVPEPEIDDGQTESTDTPEAEVFDLAANGDKLVTIKVDGEDLTVPLSEVASGYSRTADYTQKTQALAAERQMAEAFKALQQKLQENPQEVLAALQERYSQPGAPITPVSTEVPDATGDPKLDALNQRIAYFEQQEQDRLLDATLSGFEAIDSSLDRTQFVQAAVNAGITEVSQLDMFFKAQQFEKVMGKQQANEQYSNTNAADDAARQAAAVAAGQAQHEGSGVAGGSEAPTTFDSFEDAAEAAWALYGAGWD